MCFACAQPCAPPVPTTNEKWVGTCPPGPYGFGAYDWHIHTVDFLLLGPFHGALAVPSRVVVVVVVDIDVQAVRDSTASDIW